MAEMTPDERPSIDKARSQLQLRGEELSVEIRFVSDGGEEPTEVWRASLFALGWEQDWAAEQLLAAIYSEAYPPSHVLHVKRSYVNWRASGVGEQLVLDVAVGVVGSAVYESLKGAVRRLRRRVAKDNPPERGLHRDEAESRARQAVEGSFHVDENTLDLVSEEHRPEESDWAFVFEGTSGRYEAVVVDEFGSAVVTSVRRAQPKPP